MILVKCDQFFTKFTKYIKAHRRPGTKRVQLERRNLAATPEKRSKSNHYNSAIILCRDQEAMGISPRP